MTTPNARPSNVPGKSNEAQHAYNIQTQKYDIENIKQFRAAVSMWRDSKVGGSHEYDTGEMHSLCCVCSHHFISPNCELIHKPATLPLCVVPIPQTEGLDMMLDSKISINI